MSSIAMSHQRSEQAELFLKQQMEEYGGSARRQGDFELQISKTNGNCF